MPKKQHHSLVKKMQTVWLLRDHDYKAASEKSGVSVRTIRKWEADYRTIESNYYRYLNDEVVHRLLVAEHQLMIKAELLIDAISKERIDKAPLNQITSALGTILDRLLKIQDAKDIETHSNDSFRVEYYDATTGTVSTTPPWAEDDSEPDESVRTGLLRQTFWQDGASETGNHRSRHAGREDLVARADVSHGRASLARFEDDDDERDWYQD